MIKAGAKVRILENSTARTEEERLSRIGKCYFISRVRKWHNQETCFYIKENGCFVGFEEKEIEVVQNYRDFSIEEWENAIKDGFVAQKVLEFSIEEWYNSRNFIAREVLATEIESKSPHIKLGQELRVISVCSDGSNLILCVEDVKGNVFEEWAKYFVITNRTRIEC